MKKNIVPREMIEFTIIDNDNQTTFGVNDGEYNIIVALNEDWYNKNSKLLEKHNIAPDNLCSHLDFLMEVLNPIGIEYEELENFFAISKESMTKKELKKYLKKSGWTYYKTFEELWI